jgi:glycosyltransferase involved in cell wall biosynthesis
MKQQKTTQKKQISIIIPVKNEEQNISKLHETIKKTCDDSNISYEIIFVDDGSTDHTFNELEKAFRKDNNTNIIRFARNFQKAAALTAGFQNATGEYIITMDGDLQDDPREIPRFLEKINKGYDLVVGWKKDRKDPLGKRIASKIFNKLNKMLFGTNIHDSDCGYKIIRREVATQLNIYGGLYRHIPTLVKNMGYRITEIPVTHHPRKFGESKYGWTRLISGPLDLLTVKFLTNYMKKPLHFFGSIGLWFVLMGVVSEIYVMYYKLIIGEAFSIHMAMLLFGVLCILLGVQLISIGLIGELITSNNKQSSFVIQNILEHDKKE